MCSQNADVRGETVFAPLDAAAFAVDEFFDAIAEVALPGERVLVFVVSGEYLVDRIYAGSGQLSTHGTMAAKTMSARHTSRQFHR